MKTTTVPAFLDSDGLRALFITNECAGLGHLRRTINLARAVTENDPDATALIVTGSAALGSFVLPDRVDTVKLPVFRREADGTLYAATLGVDMPMIESMRSEILRSAAAAFDPDVVVVDKTPLGLRDELVPMLELLRTRGRARVVLGLRNVEDDPARVRAAWSQANTLSAVARYYDCALVYGPANTTSDALSCLEGVEMPVPVTHVGFVGNRPATTAPEDLPGGYLLVTVGGGSDGHELIDAVLDAEQHAPLPLPIVVVTGPLMPASEVARLANRCDGDHIRLFDFRHDMANVLAGARGVVTMGGYNTISEVLQTGVPALVVPRVRPSEEQLIRANDLVALGLADMLHPDEITPERMWHAVQQLTTRPRRPIDGTDYQGAARTAELLVELANERRDPILAAS
ncbi:MAG: glycosyltransferase [Ilumatobacteraceae bacterium]